MKPIKNLKNLIAAIVVGIGIVSIFASCNRSVEYDYVLPSSATVRSFNLGANKAVLNNLDSVFFSIDLYSGEIFNADSLPFGTRVTKLLPVITVESASLVELTYTDSDGAQSTYNYLEHTTDSINFTNPVKMRVVSYDGATERNYTIRVNVHTVPVDTLVWTRVENGSLPTLFSAVNAQHTTMSPDGMYYCMTMYQNEYAVAYTTDPGGSWNTAKVNNDADFNINSFMAASDALYILDTEGVLYSSTDKGVTWTPTGTKANSLLGVYGSSRLLTTCKTASGWEIVEYPSGSSMTAPAAFPVLNMSNATSVTFEMSTSAQLFVTGGRKADGTLSSDTWGFDGMSWVKVTRKSLPEKLENLAIVPYFNIRRDTVSWRVVSPNSVMLAMCGNRADGSLNDSIYMSPDYGVTWVKAPEYLQVSGSVLPPRTLAQAYPYVGRGYADASKVKALGNISDIEKVAIQWYPLSGANVLPWKQASANSRASEPVTEWDIPYIYIFGGVNSQGMLYNTVFRGVITALAQKPLQ